MLAERARSACAMRVLDIGVLSRRQFLVGAALAGASFFGRRAWALGVSSQLTIAEVSGPGAGYVPRSSALRRLLWEVDKRTSLDVRLESVALRLDDARSAPELARSPLLYLAGSGSPPPLDDNTLARLRRHLQAGGMLVVDNAEGHLGGAFDRWTRALAERLLPGEPLRPLAEDHVLYKSFYLLRGAPGRVNAAPGLEGITHDGRAALVYSQNDLGGAWARDTLGRWEHEVVPGGEEQREMALRVGINLLLYATCLDYKADQVHVPFILNKRRWRVTP